MRRNSGATLGLVTASVLLGLDGAGAHLLARYMPSLFGVRLPCAPRRIFSLYNGYFPLYSAQLTENALAPVFRGLMAMEGGHMIPGQGAFPVYRNGELLGTVGGSGGIAQQDEDAARAGINAIGLSTTIVPTQAWLTM